MAEQIKSPLPQSHASTLRDDAARRLSRSPHPYHKQNSELPYASERFRLAGSPNRTFQTVDSSTDEDQDSQTTLLEGHRESANSDSGTEADDEHFLKGLPAPRLRPPKGMRGVDGSTSGTSTPLLSPAMVDEPAYGRLGRSIQRALSPDTLSEKDMRKTVESFRHNRRIEIVRRVTESSILGFVGVILCLNPEVRELVSLWKKEISYQTLVMVSLIAAYPLRLLRHINHQRPWSRPLPITIPASFDPAPLLYPPTITIFASTLLFVRNPAGFLPGLILSFSSLPRQLIPAVGGLEGCNTLHWALSSIPLLWVETNRTNKIELRHQQQFELDPEILVLIPPLHQALCTTLHYLTSTSLLIAELQLLSISLIYLLLLASSPQAIILKAVLWIGGIGLLVTCEHVLRWGVALARVPRWRFRRAATKPLSNRKFSLKTLLFGRLGRSLIASEEAASDSSDEEFAMKRSKTHEISASETTNDNYIKLNGNKVQKGHSSSSQRRHTLPVTSTNSTSKSSPRTSIRRKRSASSSVQAFLHLTQAQATSRKWLYAGYVYIWVLIIILGGVRAYVQTFALQGNEPLGWALGYFFGNIPWFRFEVVSANLQRWICLPRRSGLEDEESCHLGWVQHLRHATFGEANTRLILSAYWMTIIAFGLAIVLRLSTICEVDTRRKVFHFMMVAMLLPATYVDPTFAALSLGLILAIFLLLDLFRASQLPPLSKSLAYFLAPYVDGRDLKGPVVISHIFLLVGCATPLWLSLGALPRTGQDALSGWEVPIREVSMVAGVICVGMGDAAASLVGRRFGRRKWIWGGGKSIEGSVAFALAVGLALGLAKAWLRSGGWPANNADSWVSTAGKVGVASGVASLTEAVLTGGNDNVVVPVVLWICVKGLDI